MSDRSDTEIHRHVGKCRGCHYEASDDGSIEGYERVENLLGRHIGAPGAPCHDYRITAVTEEGEMDV